MSGPAVGVFPALDAMSRGPDGLRGLLAGAEEAGFDHVCCGDHVSFFIGVGTDGRDDHPRLHGMQVWCGVGDSHEEARGALASAMQAMYQIPFERFEKYSPAGTLEDVAGFLAPYVEAGCTSFNLIPQARDPQAALQGAAEVRRLLARS